MYAQSTGRQMISEHGEQHEALQEEVHEHAADRGERQDLARERDLLHEPGVADDRPAGTPPRARSRRGSTRAGPRAGRSGTPGRPSRGSSRTRCRRRQVEQRVQQRPREAEDAVLVLDLELLAGHPDEELVVGDDPPETLEDRSAGSNDACVRDTRSARDRFWHNGQVSRPHPLPARARGARRPHAVEREPDGGPKASPRAPRPTGPSMSSRTRMWSIWLCGRCAGHVAPAHRAAPSGQDRHDARAPEVAVAGDDDRAAPRRQLRSQRAEMAQRRELPEHRRRVHGDDVDLGARRRRSCTSTPSAGRTGSLRI